jgi:hypothetical protein
MKTALAMAGVMMVSGVAAMAVFAQEKKPVPRCYEMRTYVAAPGKMEALHARFRDHTRRLFAKHGIEQIGYWTTTEGPDAARTLVFLLAYPSREAREASWKAFRADPEWVGAKKKSEADGVALVEKAIETFLAPTDYSPLQ